MKFEVYTPSDITDQIENDLNRAETLEDWDYVVIMDERIPTHELYPIFVRIDWDEYSKGFEFFDSKKDKTRWAYLVTH